MSSEAAAGMELEGLHFSWLDHLVFALMLAVSLVVGVYFGVCGRAKNTAKVDYLHGGKSMSVLPVAMSLVVSYVSGVTMMGVPSEIYLYGTMYILTCIAIAIAGLIVNWLYLPVFFELQLTSTYEYLERRFNRQTRLLVSLIYTLQQILIIPLYVYVPALAFNQVSGVSVHIVTPIVCIVCIFYTMLGGIKAVVWTDLLQGIVMFASCFVVIGLGFQLVGSPVRVWEIAEEGGRIEFFNMNPSPFARHTFWTIVIGGSAFWLIFIGVNQGSMQKFLSVPDLRSSRRCLAGMTVGLIAIAFISSFIGLLLYAFYRDCDPIAAKAISRPDQLLPFYVMQVSSAVPGLPGLFVAAIFSGALSSMSGALNSLSATIYEDFVKQRLSDRTTDVKVNLIMQAIVLVAGGICVGLVFVVEHLGTVLELTFSVQGMVTGALLGVFTLGLLFPWANGKGAMFGALASIVLMSVIVVGAQRAHTSGALQHPWLPTSIEGCAANATDVTIVTNVTRSPLLSPPPPEEPSLLFQVSYMYYTLLGGITVIVVGLATSFCTGGLYSLDVDPALLSLPVRYLLRRHHKTPEAAEDPAVRVELLCTALKTPKGGVKSSTAS